MILACSFLLDAPTILLIYEKSSNGRISMSKTVCVLGRDDVNMHKTVRLYVLRATLQNCLTVRFELSPPYYVLVSLSIIV